ncbi:DUF3850 domain-containing protein [Listeria booriae]|uniref:DUF3850 domain-containing protein n=1 Tax=Listeria booriae TaxID=1552123 RepID=UPI001627C8F4|nr:DUF3850 domain-containing protein [Listeria booriae]MBC2149703.1 DUF3850 domain-containing protein [Listeria booriae]
MVIYSIVVSGEEFDAITTGQKKAIVRLAERIYLPGDLLVLQYVFANMLFMQTAMMVTDVATIENTSYVVLSIEKHTCDYCKKGLDPYLMKLSGRDRYHADCLEKMKKERIVQRKAPAYEVGKCSCGKRFIVKKKQEYGAIHCEDCRLEQVMDDYYVGSPDELKDRHNSYE